MLGVFNLLNSQQVTRVVEAGTNEAELVEYQPPRQVRFGVRYAF